MTDLMSKRRDAVIVETAKTVEMAMDLLGSYLMAQGERTGEKDTLLAAKSIAEQSGRLKGSITMFLEEITRPR